MEDNLEVIALQLVRVAADIDSEKRTRAEANKALLNEIKGLRSDMNNIFHGDGENPGILIKIDRLENQKLDKKEFEIYEGDIRHKQTSLDVEVLKIQTYAKGAAKVISGLIILIGLGMAALEIFYK